QLAVRALAGFAAGPGPLLLALVATGNLGSLESVGLLLLTRGLLDGLRRRDEPLGLGRRDVGPLRQAAVAGGHGLAWLGRGPVMPPGVGATGGWRRGRPGQQPELTGERARRRHDHRWRERRDGRLRRGRWTWLAGLRKEEPTELREDPGRQQGSQPERGRAEQGGERPAAPREPPA